MDIVYFIVQQAMFFSIPLLIVSLGGMFSERSGIVNIALEGLMIIGGFSSILFISMFQDVLSGQILLILAIFIAGLSGALVSLLHAVSSINLNADQTISGTAINLFAPAFSIFLARALQGSQQIYFVDSFFINKVPILGDIPFIGKLFFTNCYITTYIGVIIFIVLTIVINKTKFGLRLKACGEYPQAADSVGINVYKIRYMGVIISGALAGIGGLVFVVPTSTNFNASVAGYGFLSLAVLIFGQWRPIRVFWASLFFGILKTLSSTYSGIPVLKDINIPSDVYKMIPYIVTLFALGLLSKNSQAPKAVGIPYDRGQR